jgi:hypothetical protein
MLGIFSDVFRVATRTTRAERDRWHREQRDDLDRAIGSSCRNRWEAYRD